MLPVVLLKRSLETHPVTKDRRTNAVFENHDVLGGKYRQSN